MNIIKISPTEAYLEDRPNVHLQFSQSPDPNLVNRVQGMQIRDSLLLQQGEEDEKKSALSVQSFDHRTG